MVKSFFIIIVALLFSTCLLSQQTPEEMAKVDWPNTFNSFAENSKNVPSHFIFVIDVTEEIFGPEISSQIQSFVDALPSTDKITVIQLGPTNETMQIVPTCEVTPAIKKDISDKLKLIKFGRSGSDGLKMADCVIEALGGPGVSKSIPFVFIFSDYEFYLPSKGYFIPPQSDWNSLNSKFLRVKKGLKRSKNLVVNGLRLNNPRQKNDYFEKLKLVFGEIIPATVSGSNLLKAQFSNIQAIIFKERLFNFVLELASKQKSSIQIENKNGKIELKGANSLVYHTLVLNEESEKKVAEILNSDKLFSFFPPSDTQIEVSGTLVAEKYKNELPELADDEIKNQKVTLMTADSLIPWWLTDIIVIFLIVSLYQIFSTLKKRKFIGDIYFYPPRGFQGSFNNIDSNLNGISSAIIGENIAVSSYGKAIDVKNNLGVNTQFTIKAKKKFFGPKVIEIKSLSGFALDVVSVEKKIRLISPGTKPKYIKPGSVWRINNVEITLPRVK